jgi:hypothetical protein
MFLIHKYTKYKNTLLGIPAHFVIARYEAISCAGGLFTPNAFSAFSEAKIKN